MVRSWNVASRVVLTLTDPLASIDAAAAAPPAVPGAVEGGTLSARLKALIMPSSKLPADYASSPVAGAVNTILGPASQEAQFGESVALCADVLFPGGDGFGVPPIGWLGWSGFKMLRAKRNAKPQDQPVQAA